VPGTLLPREALLGLDPLDSVEGDDAEPWRSFRAARDRLDGGDRGAAVEALEAVTRMRDVETRHQVRAWHLLGGLGGRPRRRQERHVLGVVAEVGVASGNDILAAYADRTARYQNYSGAGVVWLRPDRSLDGPIEAVLRTAEPIAARVDPWGKSLRPPPGAGFMRLNVLTPSGIHFGEAPIQVLDEDRLARPLVRACTALMQRLTALAEQR
jgi:hypothetical protein